jgi:amino acid permease
LLQSALVGVFLLVVLGFINLLTVCYLAEASARNGSIRSGSAFVGKLVEDYLGTYASLILRISLFLFCCIVLASYYTGFASTLSAVTGWPEPVWVAVVCAAGLILILRKTLMGTLASALITGAINIAILLLLSAAALRYATLENFLHMNVPLLEGQAFDPSHIKLVFGIVLVSYFGHLSVSNCAQTVLRSDPSGRSLKMGTAAAMVVAILIYCIWSVSVVSAVGSVNLLGETGTALVPLAKQVGPGIYVLGVVFAILGLGMSSVHFGLGIFNLSRELIGHTQYTSNPSWLRSRASTLLFLLPILLVFSYVQWTYYNGTSSFTAPLELIGALLAPVLAGIFRYCCLWPAVQG